VKLKSTLCASLALFASCGGGEEAPELPPVVLPASVSIADPSPLLENIEFVEEASELVADRLVELADKLRRRDFGGAEEYLEYDFAGHSLAGLPTASRDELHLETDSTRYDVSAPTIVGAGDFLASAASWIADWQRVEMVQWKVKGAEFARAVPRWGKAHFKISFLGDEADGAPASLTAWGWGRMQFTRGLWQLAQFELESLTYTTRATPLFTEVSTSTGLAHVGIRFGQEGNDSFAWNGAAGGDADGDGLWDLYLPSRPRNFLYMGQDDDGVRTWEDEARARGVDRAGGGTGAVFLDWDNDGDQDLALGDVGWVERDGASGGNPLRFKSNDGAGQFTEVGPQVGFGLRCYAYTLVAFDAENDGFLDLFVANYGRVKDEPNNSWTQATNGMANMLFKNEGGERFVELGSEVGLGDTGWSYSAAAADADADGDCDVYVANDYGLNRYYENDGGRFAERGAELGIEDQGNGMGASWGDFSGDGELDLYVANMSSTAGNRILSRLSGEDDQVSVLKKMAAGNTIFRCQPSGDGDSARGFVALPREAGGIDASWAWSAALCDMDLDGALDVFCTNGYVTGDTPWDT